MLFLEKNRVKFPWKLFYWFGFRLYALVWIRSLLFLKVIVCAGYVPSILDVNMLDEVMKV